MRRAPTLVALLGLASIVAQSAIAQSNLLQNGNLDLTYQQVIVDNAPPGEGPEDFFLPKPLNWQNVGTRVITGPYEDEMSSEPWAGPAPTPVTADGVDPDGPGDNPGDWGAFLKAFSGNATNGPATAHLFQDVPATPGLKYILTGWAGAEPNFLAAGAEIALEFLDAGDNVLPLSGQVVNLLPTLTADNGQPFDYKQYMAMAVAPAGAVEVRARASMIGGTPNPLGGGQAFVIDDFVLTAIPEPSTIALALTSLLGVAALRRRR